jgi:hypothetical protein
MPAHINLISTRPNTGAEFWWTSNDATIAGVRDQVLAVATQRNIPCTVTVSENQLTCVTQYVVESQDDWQGFIAAVTAAVPALAPSRNSYYNSNSHTLKFEARRVDTGELIKEVTIFPQQ